MFTVFERPLTPGLIYPCTVQDIAEELTRVPPTDLGGLNGVGLVPTTRSDHWANGRYFARPKPHILLYSYPDTLTYRLSPHTKRHDIEHSLAVEIAFGMRVERQGSRWLCRWEPERLQVFTLKHVLLHEVGHHVYWMQRQQDGFTGNPSTRVKEQFAEDYALRHHCPW